MSDDIVLSTNIGTGSTLATDESATGQHYQQVKLIDPTADSETAVGVPANGVHGNAMRVTIASDSTGQVAIAAGSATIGTVNLGTFASAATTSPATLEDTASAGGDMMLKVAGRRTATPADQSGTDGDYESIQMDNGKVWTQTGGSVAHDTALGSNDNPVLCGGVAAEMDGTTLSAVAVAEGDITYFRADRDGRQLVNQSHPASGSYNLESSSAQTATTAVAQPAAGFSVYITHIQMSAITAQTAWLHDEDDAVVFPLHYFGANTGIVSVDLSANPIKLTAVKALEVTSTAAVATGYLIQYYVAP